VDWLTDQRARGFDAPVRVRGSVADLDACIAEVDRTCADALVPGEAEPDWIALLRCAASLAARLRVLGDDLVEEYVGLCRTRGRSWEEIGEAIEAGGAERAQRFHAPDRRYAPEEVSSELRAAMREMKAAALAHRNNFVGTEHVLWGLITQESSARRLVRILGVDPEIILSTLKEHFSIGAATPAPQIAWTPYARAALAEAWQLAKASGLREIGCDHVLVGLARLGRGIAADVLAEVGVGCHALERAGAATWSPEQR
jgi:hypothetical protein